MATPKALAEIGPKAVVEATRGVEEGADDNHRESGDFRDGAYVLHRRTGTDAAIVH